MADHLELQPGFRPWAPSAASTLTHVIHRFTIPLIGLFDQAGDQHIFWCLWGEAGEANLRAYAAVKRHEDAEQLRSTSDFQEIRRPLITATSQGGVMVALASEEDGILISAEVSPGLTFGEDPGRAIAAIAERSEAVQEIMEMLGYSERPAHLSI